MAEVERLRGRVREVIGRMRARIPLRGSTSGQIALGKGALVDKAKSMVRTVSARVEEVRPRIIPIVKEYRAGAKLEELMRGQRFNAPMRGDVYRAGQSVEDSAAKPYNRRAASIEL